MPDELIPDQSIPDELILDELIPGKLMLDESRPDQSISEGQFQQTRDSHPVPRTKRLGGYLVEAGLLTPAQVDVALDAQKGSGMRFGEILAERGWVKQQTIEYLMQKVILPEQEALRKGQGKEQDSEAEAKD